MHNILAGNIYAILRQSLRGRGCRVFIEGIRLAVCENRHYTYPDVMVSCDPADQRDPRMMRSPVLLVEVLSPSTEAYDRTHKFNRYKALPSLQHYLLVSQHYWLVEWFRRNEANEWTHTPLTEPTDAVVIPELNLHLTVAQVYDESGVAPLRIDPTEEENDEASV